MYKCKKFGYLVSGFNIITLTFMFNGCCWASDDPSEPLNSRDTTPRCRNAIVRTLCLGPSIPSDRSYCSSEWNFRLDDNPCRLGVCLCTCVFMGGLTTPHLMWNTLQRQHLCGAWWSTLFGTSAATISWPLFATGLSAATNMTSCSLAEIIIGSWGVGLAGLGLLKISYAMCCNVPRQQPPTGHWEPTLVPGRVWVPDGSTA